MAKIRSLKGEYFRHAGISHGGLVAKTLGAGLIAAVADDEGRFKAAADYLRGEIFTHDDVNVGDVEIGLQHLQSIDFIRLYEVQGRAFGAIKNWKDHQPVPPSRFVASKLPPPPSSRKRRQSASTPQAGRKQPSTPVSSRAGVGSDRIGIGEEKHGDVATGDNGAVLQAELERMVVPVDRDVTTLCEWFLDKRGWQAYSTLDIANHERMVAAQMLGVVHLPDLLPRLGEWWIETDPDDRPSSLEYFWAKLQDAEHARLKTEGASSVRTTDGMTKLDPTPPRRRRA